MGSLLRISEHDPRIRGPLSETLGDHPGLVGDLTREIRQLGGGSEVERLFAYHLGELVDSSDPIGFAGVQRHLFDHQLEGEPLIQDGNDGHEICISFDLDPVDLQAFSAFGTLFDHAAQRLS